MSADPLAPGTPSSPKVGPRRGFASRLAGAFRLDASVFEEVEHDPRALSQAATVVLLGGVGRGVGALPEEGISAAVSSIPIAFVMWFAVTAGVTAIGVRMLRCTSSFSELLRTLGFAAAPLVFLALGALPLGTIGTGISIVVHAASIGALVVAVRQALDTDTARALMVCAGAIGLGLALVIVLGILLLGSPAA